MKLHIDKLATGWEELFFLERKTGIEIQANIQSLLHSEFQRKNPSNVNILLAIESIYGGDLQMLAYALVMYGKYYEGVRILYFE